MLIGAIDFEPANPLIDPAQGGLGREVNSKIFTAAEFVAKATRPFLRDVLAKPKSS